MFNVTKIQKLETGLFIFIMMLWNTLRCLHHDLTKHTDVSISHLYTTFSFGGINFFFFSCFLFFFLCLPWENISISPPPLARFSIFVWYLCMHLPNKIVRGKNKSHNFYKNLYFGNVDACIWISSRCLYSE